MVQTLFSGQIGSMGNALQILPLDFLWLLLKGGLSSILSRMPLLTGLGFWTYKERSQLVGLLTTFTYGGIYFWIFSCSTYGGSPLMDNTWLNRHMKASFSDLLFLDHGKRFGNHGCCPNAVSLCGWSHNKCWTADRLARRGLPHPENCLLCDHEKETIDHLLVHCVFTREFWFNQAFVPSAYRIILPCLVGEG